MKPLRYDPDARTEFDAATDWYGERSVPIAIEFIGTVERALAEIRRSPDALPAHPHAPADSGIRRAVLPKFPFSIAFLCSMTRFVFSRWHTRNVDQGTGLIARHSESCMLTAQRPQRDSNLY